MMISITNYYFRNQLTKNTGKLASQFFSLVNAGARPKIDTSQIGKPTKRIYNPPFFSTMTYCKVQQKKK